jgi:uncharacterized protein (TIGR00297 family)
VFDRVLIGLLCAAVISLFSWFARFLTIGGAIAQFIMGWLLLSVGGWGFVVPLLVFFLSSSALSRLFRARREAAEGFFQKGARRDAGQVIANGGAATVLVVAWGVTHHPGAVAGFLGAVAAANADTWATEIGTLARGRPFLITSLEPVETGTSGGVSLAGLVAAGAGAAAVAFSGFLLPVGGLVFATAAGGFTGALVDSLLGATLQAQYLCTVCGRRTERRRHCNSAGSLDRGWQWVQNDAVNALCTVAGAGGAWWLANFGPL